MVDSRLENSSPTEADMDKRAANVIEEPELLERADVEKGTAYEVAEPELTESLLTREEAEHRELSAASTPLILTEKVVVCILVVCFVLVEAYFVGVSFRKWLDEQHHRLVPANVMLQPANREFVMMPFLFKQAPQVPVDVVKDVATPEPLEDFEGGLNLQAAAVGAAVMELPTTVEGDTVDPQHSRRMLRWTRRNALSEEGLAI